MVAAVRLVAVAGVANAAAAQERVFMGGSFSPHPAGNAFALEVVAIRSAGGSALARAPEMRPSAGGRRKSPFGFCLPEDKGIGRNGGGGDEFTPRLEFKFRRDQGAKITLHAPWRSPSQVPVEP